MTPSRGAVKNAAGLADAGVGTGNVGRKSNATIVLSKDKLKNAKKSSPSISKNQQKMQNQTVGSTLSGTNNTMLLFVEEWEQYFKDTYGAENVKWEKRKFYGHGGGRDKAKINYDWMMEFIPIDADGNPIPLKRQKVNGLDIPLPDPAMEGKYHVVYGGRISTKTGELYLQTAIFDGGEAWRKVNGHPVPRAEIHWSDHRRVLDHETPHQHIYFYDVKQKNWMRAEAAYY